PRSTRFPYTPLFRSSIPGVLQLKRKLGSADPFESRFDEGVVGPVARQFRTPPEPRQRIPRPGSRISPLGDIDRIALAKAGDYVWMPVLSSQPAPETLVASNTARHSNDTMKPGSQPPIKGRVFEV